MKGDTAAESVFSHLIGQIVSFLYLRAIVVLDLAKVAQRKKKRFLPAAKPSGPRTVRVVLLVGGGPVWCSIEFFFVWVFTHLHN